MTMRSIQLVACLFLSLSAQALSVNFTVQPATCGECNGSILAYASGGVGSYTYAWSPVPGTGQGTPYINGLCAGTWSLEVWDSMGDNVTVSIVVPMITGLNMVGALAASSVNAACPGQCTGQLLLNENALGGSAPYAFTTLPAMPLNAICGDTPFDLTVTDANGCTGTITTVVPERMIPSLLFTEVIGACGGIPTSVVAHFNVLPDVFMVTSPGGAPHPYSIVNGGIAIVGGLAGIYTITELSTPPCPSTTWPITYPATVIECATVSGDLFVDVDGDCIRNGTDFGLVGHLVEIAPGFATLTNALGHYQRQLPDGTYDLLVSDPTYTQDCPVASPVNFSVAELSPATIDLAFTPGLDPDVAISCAFGPAIVGFGQNIWLTLTNNSGVASGPITVSLDHDPTLTYCNFWYCIAPPYNQPLVLPYPTSFTSGQVLWQLDAGLAPGASRMLSVQLCVPADVGLLGTVMDYTTTATLTLNDTDLSDNTCTHSETVVGSYDPNDKQARTSSGSASEWSIANDSLITYTIRFQNTGTAPAVNVVLVDTLQTTLDLSTLKILGASHTYSTALNGRVLSFTFDHIMLPDSNTNEAGSHGFAQFSIRPMTMAEGSSVENFADIYFDFNPPIRTNTSVVSAPLSTGLQFTAAPTLTVFPNPGNADLMLDLPPGPHTITLFDATGRAVVQQRTTDTRPVINTEALPAGLYRITVRDERGAVLGAPWVKEH